jgi:hypothetical protein
MIKKVLDSREPPKLEGGYPTDIIIWFAPDKKAYLLCGGAWVEWKSGTAIKNCCG